MSITINGTTGVSGVDGSSTTPAFQGTDTNTGLFYGTDIVGISTGGSERVRVDASGNVGIGTSSFAFSATGRGDLEIAGSSTALVGLKGGSNQAYIYNDGTSVYVANNSASGNIVFQPANYAEGMRIDSSGNLLLGTTSGPDGIRLVVKSTTTESHDFYRATSTGGAVAVGYWMSDVNGTKTAVAYIRTNGGLSNYSANNTNLSDERIKTDILPATNYLDKICSIPVVTFKYKNVENAEDNLGVIAQDVEAVAPELVNNDGFGETPEDGIPLKSIYQTDLQYALMKCIQEQQAIINDLKARVTALEAKIV